jgi:hypothetical protein
MRRDARPDSSRLGSARLGSARRKHCFVYCCVIAGECFDVTVLAWRKYATIFSYPVSLISVHSHLLLVLPSGLSPLGFPTTTKISLLLSACVDYSSTMITEAVSSFETFVNVYRTTRYYIPEHGILRKYLPLIISMRTTCCTHLILHHIIIIMALDE